MAQMPRGKPRSVPDPAGDQYDEMIRYERARMERADAAAVRPASFPAFQLRDQFLEGLRNAPYSPGATGRIGGQSYREVDNGVANVLIPIDRFSPAEREEQRRAVERVTLMADYPVAGAAYGVATMVNAPPKARDQALVAGGLVNAGLFGVAPRAGQVAELPPPTRPRPEPPPWRRPDIRPRALNSSGQATGVAATLTAPLLGTGTRATGRPPGWRGNGNVFNEARGHLQARSLGGSGSDPRNRVTQTHIGSNTPQMSSFEAAVARRVRDGEVIEYSATPLYEPGVLPPSHILLTAIGSRGAPTARVIRNPAGRRQ